MNPHFSIAAADIPATAHSPAISLRVNPQNTAICEMHIITPEGVTIHTFNRNGVGTTTEWRANNDPVAGIVSGRDGVIAQVPPREKPRPDESKPETLPTQDARTTEAREAGKTGNATDVRNTSKQARTPA